MSEAAVAHPSEAVVPSRATEDERRAVWLAERRKHITATDAGKILGLSRFGGPTAVYLDKKGEAVVEETERMRWGRRLEEAIIGGFSEKLNLSVELADPYTLVLSPSEPLLACSLDARVLPDGPPVDAKNIRFLDLSLWGEEGTDQVPDEYGIQMQVQMDCLGQREAYLAALFSGQTLRVYHFHADPDIAGTVKEASRDFWRRYVETDTLPPPDGSLAYSEHLTKRLRQTSEMIVEADETSTEWARVLRSARADAKEIKKVIEEAEQNLKERIGEAAGVKGPGFRITWKASKRRAVCNLDAAIEGLLIRLEEHPMNGGFGLDRAKLRALWADVRNDFTVMKDGARSFRPRFDNDDDETEAEK